MEITLEKVRHHPWITIYADDIAIGCNDLEDTCQKLSIVLQCLMENNKKCKLSKCKFFVKELDLLGWRISYQKRKVSHDRIKVIKEWKWSDNLPKFIGIINWIDKMIPLSAEAKKKVRLVEMKKVESTNKEAIAAFEYLKEYVTQASLYINSRF
jgi:hypothetical protein